MGLAELRKKILLREAKKKKRFKELLDDLSILLRKLEEAKAELERFEKKWGGSKELKELIESGGFDDILSSLRVAFRPSTLDKLLGRHIDVYASVAMQVLKDIWPPIISFSEAYLKVKEKLPNMSPKEFKDVIERLKEYGFIITCWDIEGSEYLVLPKFHEFLSRISAKLRDYKQGFSLAQAAEVLNLDVLVAERVLDELVELGVLVKQEFPKKYWPTS